MMSVLPPSAPVLPPPPEDGRCDDSTPSKTMSTPTGHAFLPESGTLDVSAPAASSFFGSTPSTVRPTKSILKNSFSHNPPAPTLLAASFKRKRSVVTNTSSSSAEDNGFDDDDNARRDLYSEDLTPLSSPVQQASKRRKVTWEAGIKSPLPSADRHVEVPASPLPPKKKKQKLPLRTRPIPHRIKDPNKRAILVAREEVRRAILRHKDVGEIELYDQVKELFTLDPKTYDPTDIESREPPSTAKLKNYLMGMLANISLLDASCSTLVHAVIDSEWLGRSYDYARLFVKFLGTLTAARGSYLTPVLKSLVSALKEVPMEVRRLPGQQPVSTKTVYSRVHLALSYIIEIVPSGSGALSPILALFFPQNTDTIRSHVAYTLNLIRIIHYAPELRSDILALIVEKLIKIDVQTQIDLDDFTNEDDDDDEEDNVWLQLGGIHYDSGASSSLITPEFIAYSDAYERSLEDDSSVVSEEELSPEKARLKMSKECYQKMDYMIDILFSYYASSFFYGSGDDNDDTHDLLLAHFRTIILPTYRSRYSQFLLFHFSQSNSVLVDRFATCCLEIIMNKTEQPIIRQYAAAYLASFVARGAHVTSEVVRDVFLLLGAHMQNLKADYERGNNGRPVGPDLKKYAPFYATAQALMYIFCFRWRDLTTAAIEKKIPLIALELDDVVFPHRIRDLLHAVVFAKLNPLKICAPSIVKEFARISHHLNFIYVHSIIERNKHVRLSKAVSSTRVFDSRFAQAEREESSEAEIGAHMDGYFPFDPYQLRRSSRWLQGDYIMYKGIPGGSADESTTETESESEAPGKVEYNGSEPDQDNEPFVPDTEEETDLELEYDSNTEDER